MSVAITSSRVNRQFKLAARPLGMPKESDFSLIESPVDEPGDGQVLAQAVYISIDPYMRSKMSGAASYPDPINIGDTMVGLGIGRVLESHNPAFSAGDFVLGEWGWREYSMSDGRAWLKLPAHSASVSMKLGVLGMSGITAYFGLLDVCQPKAGDTVVVSGAAGAVGSLAGQIAKIHGCRVVGIAGTDAKVDYLVNELGFEGAFNYKTTSDYAASLAPLCPTGIDCYFDNVGGAISDAVLSLMNPFGRVALCGLISEYNEDGPASGPRPLRPMLLKQLRVEGFLFTRFQSRWGEAIAQMARWLGEGQLTYREQVVDGFTNLPRALIGLLRGENIGKMLVRL
jgi:NADPH-dependent curcumin reductase CurA